MNNCISNNDELALCFYKEFEVENQIKWQTFPDEEKCGGGYYDYYYAENGLYIIRDRYHIACILYVREVQKKPSMILNLIFSWQAVRK